MILLDTHVWVWLLTGSAKIAKTSKAKKLNLILESAKQSAIKVSAISLWEVAMLEAKKRISFNIHVYSG